MLSTDIRLPLVAPLRQYSSRDRLQNHASPDSRVRRSASASIHASISTRPDSASWTIAARKSPSGGIAELHSHLAQLVTDRREQGRLRYLECLRDVPRVARAARGDHRHLHRLGYLTGDLEVVALLRAV